MWKIFYILLAIILVSAVFLFPAFGNVMTTIKDAIVLVNTDFLANMPAWFNFLLSSCMVAFAFAVANNFRK